jgi:4'-phosphopantetheinyl transferase EntD
MQFDDHRTKNILANHLPKAEIAGGSFVRYLPDIEQYSGQKHRKIYHQTKEKAVSATMQKLLNSVCTPSKTPLERGKGGYRIWPEGYTGSLTHKGAIVLGSIAKNNQIPSLGIDIEFNPDEVKNLEHTAGRKEHPPSCNKGRGVLAASSVKEAVFKAFYPIHEQMLDFGEITLQWNSQEEPYFLGVAECRGSIQINIQCSFHQKWVVSTAQYNSLS